MWTLPLRRLRSVACAAVVASCLSVTAAQAQISIVEGGASFKFPVTTFRDIPFSLKDAGHGLYEATIRDAGHGRRDAVIRSERGVPFETERRIWLP